MKYLTGSTRRRAAFPIWLCLLLTCLAGELAADTLSAQIDSLLADSNLDHGIQGVVVQSLKTGAVMYEHNADLVFIPASNMKLLVSATALDKLGPDFTYKTQVCAVGKLNSRGVLEGDLILKGAGDPVLETADLAEMAEQVRNAGIRKVSGGVVVDESLFDDRRLGWGWSWDDEPYYYSAQISALNLNRNTVDVYVYPGKAVGSPALVRVVPATNLVTVENEAVTAKASAKKTIWVYRKRGRNIIQTGGGVPLGYRVTSCDEPITVEEPALYAGDVFKTELASKGITVLGKVRAGVTPADAKPVASHISPPLSKILALLNKPSDNLIAEVLLKTLGAVVKGEGTAAAGAEVEAEFLKNVGLDTGALRIVDGSGLSRLNYVSPRNLVGLLAHMHGHKNADVFLASLPIAGVDGTLRNRMKSTAAEGNVRAKSGYVSRVSSLSGYVTTRAGEQLVFSILMNNHLCANTPARAVQDKICALLADMQ